MTAVSSGQLRIKRLRQGAVLPRYMTTDAAGMDLHALLDEGVAEATLSPGQRLLIGTGLAMELPRGLEAQVRPRSGLALKHGVTVLNSPGTIDADYRGEVKVLLVNHGSEAFVIKTGERIAQLVVAPVTQLECVEVDAISTTDRGAGGYGSTGVGPAGR